MCKNHSVVTKKFYICAVIEGNQMPRGAFMCIRTSNKRVKFHVKIPSGCLENGKSFRGYFFAAHCRQNAVKYIWAELEEIFKSAI